VPLTRSSPFQFTSTEHARKLFALEELGRGLHSSTFQLNLSALYGIGGARRGCVAHLKGVLGGI